MNFVGHSNLNGHPPAWRCPSASPPARRTSVAPPPGLFPASGVAAGRARSASCFPAPRRQPRVPSPSHRSARQPPVEHAPGGGQVTWQKKCALFSLFARLVRREPVGWRFHINFQVIRTMQTGEESMFAAGLCDALIAESEGQNFSRRKSLSVTRPASTDPWRFLSERRVERLSP
jgi:hypothetical protein